MKAAVFIFEKIRELDKDFKEPKLESWANDIRLMVEQDNRTHREICELYKWISTDPFEKTVVLSTSKLRKRYSELKIKWKNPVGKGSKPEWQVIPFDNQSVDAWVRKYKFPDCPPSVSSYPEYKDKILKPEIEKRIKEGWEPKG